jgi:hypothetical protein
MDDEIIYPELRTSILKGARNYLNRCDNKKSLPGFFHGEQGRNRATKAIAYASKVNCKYTQHHQFLLALLVAIFDSSSKGLAMCIALQLIEGEQKIYGLCPNDLLPEPYIAIKTLRSLTFPTHMIDLAALELTNLTQIEDSPSGPVFGADKTACARWIIKKISPQHHHFTECTKKLKAILDDKKSDNIDLRLINPL